LRPAWLEGVVEVIAISRWLLPGIFWIAKKHAQQVASAGLAVVAMIACTSVHDAQIDELDVALLTVEFGAETFGQLFNSIHGMLLLVRYRRHTGVPGDQWRPKKRSFDQLAYGLALGEEERRPILEVRLLVAAITVSDTLSVCIAI
jgi:hypothetical protein